MTWKLLFPNRSFFPLPKLLITETDKNSLGPLLLTAPSRAEARKLHQPGRSLSTIVIHHIWNCPVCIAVVDRIFVVHPIAHEMRWLVAQKNSVQLMIA